ncbi:MAG: glycosyltransferase [Phycisphaerae bacterium]|nr:glycosyltransferase [Phycisphaerae bacterium]
MGALVWRLILWRRYRPTPAVADAELPSLTLVIPAYNEGELVRHSILAAAASRYPAERFEIIVVDDGSTDDTWRHIQAAVREVGERVSLTTLRHGSNRGKRAALLLGFRRARGALWATTDSDSLLDAEALRLAAAPLVRDERVSCVSGCVEALNGGRNLYTRFMKCYYSLSFKFVRAYQDGFRGVFCAPGALSVYRASAARPILEEWGDQRFLGVACATGEDRAITNLLLREGGVCAYQQSAVVLSRAPESYVGMAKMFLRWARSNIRETIVLWRFLFTRFRDGSLAAFRFNSTLALVCMLLTPFLVGHAIGLALFTNGFILRYLAAMVVYSSVMATVYFINERDEDWVWLLIYPVFSTICFSWVMPYAACTLRNTGWLTRGARGDADRAGANAITAGLIQAHR